MMRPLFSWLRRVGGARLDADPFTFDACCGGWALAGALAFLPSGDLVASVLTYSVLQRIGLDDLGWGLVMLAYGGFTLAATALGTPRWRALTALAGVLFWMMLGCALLAGSIHATGLLSWGGLGFLVMGLGCVWSYGQHVKGEA